MGRFYLSLIPLLFVGLAYAASHHSVDAAHALSLNAPAQQSECEIQLNKLKVAHPDTDMLHISGNTYADLLFGPAVPPAPPSTYRDAKSGITFYAESDGRHVAAIDSHGKLLWIRNPFVDSDMCPYRSAHPYIYKIGDVGSKSISDSRKNALIVNELNDEIARGRKVRPPKGSDRFIHLMFNSSQEGYIDIRNGDFYFMGQN